MRTCKGWIKTSNGRTRKCKRTGNAVFMNDYCRDHQYYAVQFILKDLQQSESELKRLQSVSTPRQNAKQQHQIRLLQGQIQLLKKELHNARKICSQDTNCSSHLKDFFVSIQELTSHYPKLLPQERASHPITKLKNLRRNMTRLSLGTRPVEAHAFQTSHQYELARRQKQVNEARIENLRNALNVEHSRAQELEDQFQMNAQTLNQEYTTNEQDRQRSAQVIASLQKQLDRCSGESKQVSGLYTETINKLQAQGNEYKDLYNNMVGREIKLSKQVEMLAKNEQNLKQALSDLEQSYENKLNRVRQEYAEQVKSGGVVLSDREQELMNEVERLKVDLSQALEDIKVATAAGKEAVEQSVSAQQPYSELARQLKYVNNMLRQKNEELGRLQADSDYMRDALATKEMQCAQNVDRATAKDQSEIQRLSNRLATVERDLAGRQQEIVSLQTAAYDLRRQNQNQVQQLNNRLRNAQNELTQYKTARQAERRNLEQQFQLMKNREKSAQLNMDFKFKQLQEELNQRYSQKANSLQEQYENNRIRLEQERRNLQLSQQQTKEQAQLMQKQKMELENYRNAYEEKMAEFLQQKEALQTALSQAQTQAAQFNKIENDYKNRVNILRQSVTIQAERHQQQINNLNNRLKQALADRSEIVNNLEKCNAARDGLVTRVNTLVEENTRFKDQYMQLKSRMELMRSQYEAQLEKLRSESGRLENDIRACAQKLEDASLVHDHVKRMQSEARSLRTQLEEKIRRATDNEKALQRLLKDRDLKESQVVQLQSALRDCGVVRKQLESKLQNTNVELRDVKRMHGKLSTDIQSISADYQRALENRQSSMVREEMRNKAREDQLNRELANVQLEHKSDQRRLQSLQQSKEVTENILANSELDHAKQIDMLLRAQQLAGQEQEYLVTGQSNLVQS